ncbi:transcriptional regulator, LysR family [Cribrihabitans marinus]|uniref:Transcriptional regulator, LysR family n=1 Tax=Cribrihabitans marinus TaxID=1227549 RepID=A0A1H6SW22_9RHOB|nr:LysR family transcriptional regulator [Cribrihabitans marinus]GGH23259.1 LysR family transcriptional regulator [Cribrihabitans marinus]SEI68240.1 transcriptional regulator, LysR family [Cribrihabitans marinus]
MIELRDLQLLDALARHRHFAKAAEECGISQPAFSMRIRKLEDRLGISIVRRANRFQGLTEEGEMIVRRARRILDDTRALEQEVQAARGEITGTLALGVIPTALSFASRLVRHLLAAHPRIVTRIETLTSSAIQGRLDDGTIDAGVTYSDSIGADLRVVQPLYEEHYVALIPERMADGQAALTWAQAAALPLCLLVPQMQNRRIIDRVFADQGLHPQIIAETSGFTAAMAMACEGLAATVVPRVLVESLGPLAGTRALDLIEPTVARPICLATLDRDPGLPAVAALRTVAASLE